MFKFIKSENEKARVTVEYIESIEKEEDIDFYTTTTTRACEAPSLTEVYLFFKDRVDDASTEAEKFHAYNAKRDWDCLPNWKETADLWIARIGEHTT